LACTPATGWEMSQFENQVGKSCDLLFWPRGKRIRDLPITLDEQL